MREPFRDRQTDKQTDQTDRQAEVGTDGEVGGGVKHHEKEGKKIT